MNRKTEIIALGIIFISAFLLSTSFNSNTSQEPEKTYEYGNFYDGDQEGIKYLRKDFCGRTHVRIAETIREFSYCLNKDGFRDDDVSQRKGDKTRIVALGDAVTFGIGVNNSDTWPQQLEADLNSKYKEKYQVLNFGFPYKATREEVIWFNRSARKYNPDLVILQYMRNDPQNLTRVNRIQQGIQEDQGISSGRARIMAIQQEKDERANLSVEQEMQNVVPYLESLDNYSERDDFQVAVIYYRTRGDSQLEFMRNYSRENDWLFTVSEARQPSTTINSSFVLNPAGHSLMAGEASGLVDQWRATSN